VLQTQLAVIIKCTKHSLDLVKQASHEELEIKEKRKKSVK
jgi:hypothetical protein